jgi:serine/threonine protein kinase
LIIWLGGGILHDDRLLLISQLFGALKLGIFGEYSLSIKEDLENPEFLHPAGFPFIQEYPLNNRSKHQQFRYEGKLSEGNLARLIYMAKLDKSDHSVVIKFVSTYNAPAHRLLADNRLAPNLHYASTEDTAAPKYGRLYMVVMDFFDGSIPTSPLSDDFYSQFSKAIKLLHSKDLVFGDLRAPNILTNCDKTILIDFDWCGKAGKGNIRWESNLRLIGQVESGRRILWRSSMIGTCWRNCGAVIPK